MNNLIDMKLPPSTKETTNSEVDVSSEGNKPEYPWGLRITLDNDSLAKLGIKDLPAIDSEWKVTAMCCVTSVRQNEYQGDKEPNRNVELQIEMMAIEPGKEEDTYMESLAKRMFPKSGQQ